MIQELLNRADRRGYITFEDVMELLEDEADDTHTFESVLDELDELGIELRQDDLQRDETDELDDEYDSEGEEIQEIGDINAVSPDDPVGLYFRQMAQEPLLTAQEEVELAKRIERGKAAAQKLAECPALSFEERAELELFIRDGQAAREHLGRAKHAPCGQHR